MDDLIHRADAVEALRDALSDLTLSHREHKMTMQCLDDLPTTEIIHCSECVHYGRADKRRFYRGYDCLQGRIASIVPDRDFCSRAERREVTE